MFCNLHAHAYGITATTYATHMHKENKVFKYIGLLNIAINIFMRRNGMGIKMKSIKPDISKRWAFVP